MDETQLIHEISVKDVDVNRFAQLAICENHIRDMIIRQMITHPHIMVYYHCYYVIEKASRERPGLFYRYWHDIASLLNHKNSYHRDFALTIIGNLTQVDEGDLFSTIYDDYFEHINDEKFMTGQCCIQNSIKILSNHPKMRDEIISLLLDMDNLCTYTEKQKGLLKCNVLEVLDGIYAQISDKERINEFIKAGVGSVSPKTRRKAKELVEKYGL